MKPSRLLEFEDYERAQVEADGPVMRVEPVCCVRNGCAQYQGLVDRAGQVKLQILDRDASADRYVRRDGISNAGIDVVGRRDCLGRQIAAVPVLVVLRGITERDGERDAKRQIVRDRYRRIDIGNSGKPPTVAAIVAGQGLSRSRGAAVERDVGDDRGRSGFKLHRM